MARLNPDLCGRFPFVAALGTGRSRGREPVWDVFLEGGSTQVVWWEYSCRWGTFLGQTSLVTSHCGCSSLLQPIVGTGAIHPLTGCHRGLAQKCNCKIDKK